MRIDLKRNALVFVQMSRESYRWSSFLDKRAFRSGPASFSAELMELLPQLPILPERRPLHFILHGAFCGSTLLARYLDAFSHCLVLKEPHLLFQLARLRANASAPTALEPHLWANWLRVAMVLFARGYPSDAAVIIKANDVCNWMGNLLLDHDIGTKIIFLSSPLKVFLLSVLKNTDRRKWVRQRVRELRAYLSEVPFLTETVVAELSDGQCGAAVWLLNSFLCSFYLARSDSDRVLPLSSETLIWQPRDVVYAAVDFLGLTCDEANRRELTTVRPLSYYSKDPLVPYDAVTRAKELGNTEAQFGPEVEVAISWAKQVSWGWLSRSPFSIE
jgi:hypothetical protein